MSNHLDFLKTLKSDFDKASAEKAEQIDVLSSTTTDTVSDLDSLEAQKQEALKMAKHYDGLIKEQEKKEKEEAKAERLQKEEETFEPVSSAPAVSLPSTKSSDIFYPKGWDDWSDKRKQSEAKKVKNPELLRKKRPNHAFFVEGYLGTTSTAAPLSTPEETPISLEGPVADFLREYRKDNEALDEREMVLADKRAKLKVHEEDFKKFLELGFTSKDFYGCYSPDDLREKLLASKLSKEYIDQVFPNLDEFYFAQYDLQDLRFEEYKLKFKKEFAKSPMKLFKRIDPILISRLEQGESPDYIAQEIYDLGLSAVAPTSKTGKKVKELEDAGFTHEDIVNYKETRKKIAKDPVYRKKAQKFVHNKNVKRKARGKQPMSMPHRVLNITFALAALPLDISMDLTKAFVVPFLRPKKRHRVQMDNTARLLKTMALFAKGDF